MRTIVNWRKSIGIVNAGHCMCQLDEALAPGYAIWVLEYGSVGKSVACLQAGLSRNAVSKVSCSFFNPKEISMAALKGSKTEDNLKAAFAVESQANQIGRASCRERV